VRGSATDLRLMELIAAEGPVAVTEPVIMEVPAGARSDARQADLRRLSTRSITGRSYGADRIAPPSTVETRGTALAQGQPESGRGGLG
jgi:hypothetical protein